MEEPGVGGRSFWPPREASAGVGFKRRSAQRLFVAGVSALVMLAAAACGSSSSSQPSSSGSSSAVPGSASSSGANVDAAKAALAAYTGHATAFPVNQPLSKPLPAGSKLVFLQCSSPVCGQVAKSFQAAVTAIGGTPVVVNSGATAQTAQAAASSVLSMKPDVVLLSGADPALYGGGLKALSAAGARVVSIQVNKDVAPFGITFNYLGANLSEQNGKLLADWVIVNKGAAADAVLYTLPALDLSPTVQKAFQGELAANCPSCKARAVPIDVSTVGTTAPRTVVTDLQAHPQTNVAVFVSFQVATGLPAALKAAGLKVSTVGFAPTAGNLQDIKNGNLTAGLAIDFPVSIWTAVDTAARLTEKGQVTQGEQTGQVPEQFLGQQDITFDPTKGWTGYPDYTARFTKLWHPAS